MASYARLLFTDTVWIFSCPQSSALENVSSVLQLLVWNLLPINKFIYEAQKGIMHIQSIRSGEGKAPAGYLKSA